MITPGRARTWGPDQIADRIIEDLARGGQVRVLGGAPSEQKHLVHDADRRWLGITASFAAPVVTLFAGTLNDAGGFNPPVADSGPPDAEDRAALARAVSELWQLLGRADV
ncbi:hypothetical protein [Streptacidiphilus albus]|uniref:hypothetical protein n=1 Tax=Streptacidiphilus albus TaxID=105425 RepID=UPI00054B7F12|nr:hypothetical protein [Streptacidiphilus albus]